ncbi:MAG: dTDP-4-dehydrorhamnose reductase [Bacteroidota bacterium]
MNSDLLKKRIMIIGSNGMLGQRLTENYKADSKVELFCCSAEESSFIENVEYLRLDITIKKNVHDAIQQFYPDFIISAAAYTNVDGCETEKELAWKVNVTGVENIARHAILSDAHVIHISTDYVFDGKNGPYSEKDLPNPIGYYGRTKLASENALKTAPIKNTIIRTNVLYGPAKHGRPDFVKWVVNSLRGKKKIRIVTDQINNPTFLDDLVDGINRIIEYKKEGLYNIGGSELLSRYEFTLRIADFFELDKSLIEQIVTSELNQPAPRPLNSGLLNLKAQTELGYRPLSLDFTFSRIKKELDL